jgi:hypothetical protein
VGAEFRPRRRATRLLPHWLRFFHLLCGKPAEYNRFRHRRTNCQFIVVSSQHSKERPKREAPSEVWPFNALGPRFSLGFCCAPFIREPFRTRIFARRTILVSGPHGRFAGNDCANAMALATHTPRPIHRHDVPCHRAGNDRLAGSGVDREVRRTQSLARCWFRCGMLSSGTGDGLRGERMGSGELFPSV